MALSASQLKSRESRIVGYTSESARKTNIDKGYVSAGSKAAKAPIMASGVNPNAPAYNAQTGATTGKPSAEYDAYLKSLNKVGSANYVDPTGATPKVNPAVAPVPTTPNDIVNFDTKTGQQLAPGATTIQDGTTLTQGQRYKQQLAQTMASNTPVAATQGIANMTTQSAALPQKEDTSIVDQMVAEATQPITDMFQDYFSPENQRKSLFETAKPFMKEIGKLDEEIIDAKTVIEGTEDDIRNEIQQAGGFGTDSQVQALALSRNKVLLKNYNNLVSMRESKANSLDTMMNLAEKDRAYADSQFDKMLNYQTQMVNYRDKFIQNARDQYNKYDPATLYATLANEPRQLAFAEQIMGMGPGGLQRLASAPLSRDAQLDLDLKKAQLRNINSQISERDSTANSYGTLSGKPQNASQSSANGYADRLSQSELVISNLGSKFTGKFDYGGSAPNFLQSGDRQTYEQAKKNFVTAVLRRESGASIAPSEFQTAQEQYFPQPGDKPDVLTQKESLRNTVINNFYREAGVNRPVLPGQIIESDGKKYKVGSDGQTLTEI